MTHKTDKTYGLGRMPKLKQRVGLNSGVAKMCAESFLTCLSPGPSPASISLPLHVRVLFLWNDFFLRFSARCQEMQARISYLFSTGHGELDILVKKSFPFCCS